MGDDHGQPPPLTSSGSVRLHVGPLSHPIDVDNIVGDLGRQLVEGCVTPATNRRTRKSTIAMFEMIEVIHMIREAPAMTVRQRLGDLLNEVQYRRGRIVITKGGKPVAALVDIALFERIRKLDEEFDRALDEMARAFSGIPANKGEALVAEAVAAARRKRAKRRK